jgi:hypothetical protein
MPRIRQEDDYFGERTMMTDEEALGLFDNPSRVVDSVMRELDSFSALEYDEDLL